MPKVIAIGECVLDIIFDGDTPRSASPGGLILNVATALSRLGRQVCFVGEAARDCVGDIIVDHLETAGVNTRSIDRFTDSVTPTSLIFNSAADHEKHFVRYRRHSDELFDVVWPDIQKDDIVIFGGYYAIDPRVHHRLFEIVRHAVERKAIIIYVPGFAPDKMTCITHVMPSILENFEVADIVITRERDLRTLWNITDATAAYEKHVSFYTHNLINFDRPSGTITYFHAKQTESLDGAVENSFAWTTGAIAGVADALMSLEISRFSLTGDTADIMSALTSTARETGLPLSQVLADYIAVNPAAAYPLPQSTMTAILQRAVEVGTSKPNNIH